MEKGQERARRREIFLVVENFKWSERDVVARVRYAREMML